MCKARWVQKSQFRKGVRTLDLVSNFWMRSSTTTLLPVTCMRKQSQNSDHCDAFETQEILSLKTFLANLLDSLRLRWARCDFFGLHDTRNLSKLRRERHIYCSPTVLLLLHRAKVHRGVHCKVSCKRCATILFHLQSSDAI